MFIIGLPDRYGLSVFIDNPYDFFYFRAGHDGGYRQRNNCPVNFFADRVRPVVPFGIGFLFMRRSRVMNDRLYAFVGQVLLKTLTFPCAYDKNCHTAAFSSISLRQDNQRIGNIFSVIRRDFAAARVVRVQMRQFDVQHRRLQFVQTAVRAFVNVVIFSVRAVIRQSFDFFYTRFSSFVTTAPPSPMQPRFLPG